MNAEVPHATPEFPDVRQPTTGWDDTLALAKVRRDEWNEKRIYQERATVVLPTEWPITVFAIGDVHFGSVYSDTDRFMRDIDMIRQTPNTFIVFMSNLIDNGNPSQFPDSMLANSMTPHDQVKGMNDLVKQLDEEDKVLGAVKSPCHEGWLWKKSGIDINELIFANTKFPKLDNGGTLKVQLPGAEYNVALFHQFGPFGSHFNKNHPSQQMQRLVLGGKADVVILAHSHVGEALQTYYGVGSDRKDVAYIRSGAYKGNVSGKIENTPDMWIKDKSGMDAEPGSESVMLRADRREMAVFLKPETAIEYHRAYYKFIQLQALGLLGEMDAIINSRTVADD